MNQNITQSLRAYYKSLPVREKGQFLLASCIAQRGRVISFGFNKYKSHPLSRYYPKKYSSQGNRCLCAELDAIRNAKKLNIHEFNKFDIYVYREHRNGANALACPCAGCVQTIETLGFRGAYFTNGLDGWDALPLTNTRPGAML